MAQAKAAPKQKAPKQKPTYVRQQKGHSAIIGWLILGPFTMFILPIYWTISPNHYWHF